jgi:pyruvate-ferredoxin/flavodoxin oxidoreductase
MGALPRTAIELGQTRPAEAEQLITSAQESIDEKYRTYENMAGWDSTRFHPALVGA